MATALTELRQRVFREDFALGVLPGALLAVGTSSALSLASVALRAAASRLGWRPEHALAIPPYAAAMLGVNLHHYWLDGRVWRRPSSNAGR